MKFYYLYQDGKTALMVAEESVQIQIADFLRQAMGIDGGNTTENSDASSISASDRTAADHANSASGSSSGHPSSFSASASASEEGTWGTSEFLKREFCKFNANSCSYLC